MNKPGRNDPCPCRSGKKYKHCCGAVKIAPAPARSAVQVTDRAVNVDALVQMAAAASAQGRLEEAVACLQKAISVEPRNTQVRNLLAKVFSRHTRHAEATMVYRGVLSLLPDSVEVLHSLANSLFAQEQWDEAIIHLQKAISIDPGNFVLLNALGIAFYHQSRMDEALLVWREAHSIGPDDREVHLNVGLAYMNLGDHQRANAVFREIIEEAADFYPAHKNLLFSMQFGAQYSIDELRAAQKKYSSAIEAPLLGKRQKHRNDRQASRRIKVGYVSADFRHHPIALFIAPILQNHHKASIETFCYYNNPSVDGVTKELKAIADNFVPCSHLSDDQLAEYIRLQEIDILVDLSGHTAGNRLAVFAQKPAPVQITYLGFSGSTGLSAMDYLLTDSYSDEAGSDASYTERLLRLKNSRFCFRPPTGAMPDITPLPAIKNGYITFGSFCNVNKIDQLSIEVWAQLLREIPDARLRMVTIPEGNTRQRFLDAFAALGVSGDRITFHGKLIRNELWQMMSAVDMALDTVSINSPTTMCESLWMGLPTISLVGNRPPSRIGLSILHSAGFPAYAAHTPAAYANIARGLAQDTDRLAKVRLAHRETMVASALMDEAGFTRDLEEIYRRVWREWCESM